MFWPQNDFARRIPKHFLGDNLDPFGGRGDRRQGSSFFTSPGKCWLRQWMLEFHYNIWIEKNYPDGPAGWLKQFCVFSRMEGESNTIDIASTLLFAWRRAVKTPKSAYRHTVAALWQHQLISCGSSISSSSHAGLARAVCHARFLDRTGIHSNLANLRKWTYRFEFIVQSYAVEYAVSFVKIRTNGLI